jgi:hypothetical protein
VAQVASCCLSSVKGQVRYKIGQVGSVGDKLSLTLDLYKYYVVSILSVFIVQPTLHNHITAANYNLQSTTF